MTFLTDEVNEILRKSNGLIQEHSQYEMAHIAGVGVLAYVEQDSLEDRESYFIC